MIGFGLGGFIYMVKDPNFGGKNFFIIFSPIFMTYILLT
jgi:hypothetical protein